MLRDLIVDGEWDSVLHRATAIKLGAVLGAMPIFLVSLTTSIGELFTLLSPDRAEVAKNPAKRGVLVDRAPEFSMTETKLVAGRFAARLMARARPSRSFEPVKSQVAPEATSQEEPGRPGHRKTVRPQRNRLGVVCSGGGIRSAAFNLGALQAMESRAEMKRADAVISVSGGSYMAAAWVTARATTTSDAWERRSGEEKHLRRNTSYLAPGLTGKLWALARFTFSFITNLGLIVLLLGVLAVPFGLLVDKASSVDLAGEGSRLELPEGGCVTLADGSSFTLLPILHPAPGGESSQATTTIATSTSSIPTTTSSTPATTTATTTSTPTTSAESTPTDMSDPRPRLADSDNVVVAPDPLVAAEPSELPVAGDDRETTVSCPAASTAAARAPGIPANAPGQKLSKGRSLDLRLGAPLPITAASVPGCQGAQTCSARDATFVSLFDGSRLTSAPRAVVVLSGDALVLPDGSIARPCGHQACREFDPPDWLKLALGVLLGAAALGGASLVVARSSPADAKVAAAITKRVCLAALLLFLVTIGLSVLVVWAENGRWWLQGQELESGIGATAAVVAALGAQLRPFLGGIGSKKSESKVAEKAKGIGTKLRRQLVRLWGRS